MSKSKTLAGAIALVATFVAAFVMLAGVSSDSAEANIISVSASSSTINAAGTSTLTIDAQDETAATVAEIQTISLTGCTDNDDILITFDGVTSGDANVTDCNGGGSTETAAVTAAIVGLASVPAAGVTTTVNISVVTAPVYTVTFAGGGNVPQMTVAGGTGKADTYASATVTEGSDKPIQILSTTGTVGTLMCTGGTVACPWQFGETTNNVTIPDAGNSNEIITAVYTAPATGPAVATITIIQDGDVEVKTIKVRGATTTVEMSVTNLTSSGDPLGIAIKNIRADLATLGEATAFINARPKDTNGNELTGTVVFSTTDGTLSSTTDTIGSGWSTVSLVSDSSTDDGDTETVTAAHGGGSASTDVHFSGNPETCTMSADPVAPAAGGIVAVAITFLDSSGGPVADGILLTATAGSGDGDLTAVNSEGTGTFSVFGITKTGNGAAGDGISNAQLAVGMAGGTAVLASSDDAVCSTTVTVGGSIAVTGGTFTGAAPAAGSIGLLVTSGAANAADLITALGTAGCTADSVAVLEAGAWLVYINGAPDVVNAAFPASLADVTPFFARCA